MSSSIKFLAIILSLTLLLTIAGCPKPPQPHCGNGVCDAGETDLNCPGDCHSGPVCGNNSCDSGETYSTCPSDCGMQPNGNGTSDVNAVLTVDAASALGQFKNIAPGVNIGAKTQGQDLAKFMGNIGSDFFRIKVWTWTVNEELDNYFTEDGIDAGARLKEAVDTIQGNGGKVMIQFYGVPEWLSTCTNYKSEEYCNRVVSNAVPEYSKYPPSDYAKWQELVKAMVVRMQELGVKPDYLEIYGEANIGSTWYWKDAKLNDRVSSFLVHYEKTAGALLDADPSLKIGGAAFAFSMKGQELDLENGKPFDWSKWTKDLVAHIKENDLPLDFFSWHSYNSRVEILRHNAGDLRKYLDLEGFEEIPLFLTEWGVDGGENLRDKANTHFGSSFAIAALMELSNSDNDAQAYYALGAGKNFGLIAQNHEPKAAFNAFELYSKLEGNELVVENTDPVYMVKPQKIGYEHRDIKAIATSSPNQVSLLATYYVPVKPELDPEYDLEKEVKIVVKNIPFGEYSYRIYLIDGGHSNSHYNTGPGLEVIEEGNSTGDFEKQFTLKIYGTILLEISSVG